MRTTHTFATLEIPSAAWEAVKAAVAAAGPDYLERYMHDEATIVFSGSEVGLVVATCGDLPPHQVRVLEERIELSGRLDKLKAFITMSPVFATLPPEDRLLLNRQFDAMDAYRRILGERLERFGLPVPAPDPGRVTQEQFDAAIEAKKQADLVTQQYCRQQQGDFRARWTRFGAGEFFTLEDLRFSAEARCWCGAGLAYPKDCGPRHQWTCSAILLGSFDRFEPKKHEVYPFAFYEIKSEEQPSANGATTRPPPLSAGSATSEARPG